MLLWFNVRLSSERNQISGYCDVNWSLYKINHHHMQILPQNLHCRWRYLNCLHSTLMMLSVYHHNNILSVQCLLYICCSTSFPMSRRLHTQTHTHTHTHTHSRDQFRPVTYEAWSLKTQGTNRNVRLSGRGRWEKHAARAATCSISIHQCRTDFRAHNWQFQFL